jgi:hypothetical protein
MALSNAVNWYVRAGGAETNGGGFDSTVAGAGVNYADQDSPQLSITDLVSTASTTVTSAIGGFTANMVGNVLRLASATGSPVADSGGSRYLMITGYTNTNTITVDKVSGTYTAGIAKVGGAHASVKSYSNGGSGAAPALTTPVLPGHTINIRGAGSRFPTTVDFTETSAYFNFPGGDSTNGPITFKGYNGRPLIAHWGLLFFQCSNLAFIGLAGKQTVSTFSTYGMIYGGAKVYDCMFDQAGIDATQLSLGAYPQASQAVGCYFKNTGATTAGTNFGFIGLSYGVSISDSSFINIRGGGVSGVTGSLFVNYCVIAGVKNHGIQLTDAIDGYTVKNCTIDSPTGDCLRITNGTTPLQVSYYNNIFSNAGGYGVNFTTNTTAVNDRMIAGGVNDYNNFYNNASGARNNVSAGPNDQAVNPSYVGGGNYAITAAI